MHYLMTHPGAAWALTVVHLRLSLLPVLIGLMSAVPLGLLVQRAPLLRRLTTATASVIFTIPSLALFVVLPLIIGTRILDEANVIVALAAYTTALLVRAVLEALDAVPAQVHDAATAIGYSRIAQMLKVELPLSIPVLVAGLRVVAVTNIAMVSVGSVIGIGGLGTWFTAGYQTNKSDQIVAGVVAMFLLAIVVDVVINLADRVGRQSGATIADVLAEKELSHYNDIRAHTSVNAVNLEVLPAPEYSSAQRALSDADWHFIADPASRFYNLVLADCGAGFFDPLTRGVLSTVSGVVVVASVSIDGAQQASVALDWLRNNGYQDLASRACVVINHIMPGEPNVAVKDLVRHFEQQVQPGRVVVMPWDRHIAAGTEISLDLLDPIYKRKVLELAAALSDDFERAGRR